MYVRKVKNYLCGLRYYGFVCPPLILASASPQRRELLEGLGLPFTVRVSRVSEADVVEHDPVIRAQLLAKLKAEDVGPMHPGAYIIGCDTLVVAADGTLLEKPADAAEARSMIALQSGSVSTVHSGLCVLSPDGSVHAGVSSSSVHFKKMDDAELNWWVTSGCWRGRSGAFQIDGLGQLIIEKISGDWTGVVGLPVFLLGELLRKAGWPLGIGD